MLNDTTFIFASLNNGYDNNPEDPVENYHFERTLFSVNTLKKLYNVNIIFVDWCSEEKNKYQNNLEANIKYVYVPPSVNDFLHKDNKSTQQFYEWIAKDIGAHLVKTNRIAFVNGDNLFPKKFIKKLSELESSPDVWYTAKRINIGNSVFKDKEKLLVTLDSNPFEISKEFDVIDTCTFCSGDFTYIHKSAYEDADGYGYSHKHAYEDAYLSARLETNKIKNINIPDEYYHLHHQARGSARIFSESIINKQAAKQFILQNIEVAST